MNRISFFWGIFFPLLFCVSCNEDEKLPLPELALGQTEIRFENAGGETTIDLTANSNWHVENIPDWLSLDRISGDTSYKIAVTAKPNDGFEDRAAAIVFFNDSKRISLNIYQSAGKRELSWASLRFSTFEDVSFTVGENNNERIYTFKTRRMFVNPSVNPAINNKLFLGNLVDRSHNSITDISEYKDYTFDSISVGSSAMTVRPRNFIPSKIEQENYANEILAKNPTQSETFLYDGTGVVYNSHRELNLIGKGNLGISLDEIISGKSYREQEMEKKSGVIFSFSHSLFTLFMDLQEHIVKEHIDKDKFPENSISYISSVSYGRIGVLMIESDNSVLKVKTIVKKLVEDNSAVLSEEETIIADELNACHLYFDKYQNLQIKKGKIDVIQAFKKQLTEDIYNVYPFKYTVCDCFEPGDSEMTFQITLP